MTASYELLSSLRRIAVVAVRELHANVLVVVLC